MPAAVDVCLLFVAAGAPGRDPGAAPLAGLVPLCQELLPPRALVVGCCGRGLFGIQGGTPVELDPSQGGRGASVLLGRLPGTRLRAYAAQEPAAGGWSSAEAMRSWLGLGLGEPPPDSCLLFGSDDTGGLEGCAGRLAAALPGMVLTGGNCPDEGELFCSQPLQQPSDAADAAAAEGSEGGPAKRRSQASQRPSFVGLLVSQQGHDEPGGSAAGGCKPKLRCAGLTSQGMKGGEPLLTHVHLIRSSVTLQRLSPTARSRVGPGPAARHGNRAREDSARSPASPCHSSLMRTSVTCPAALAARGGTRFNASRRLPPLALACVNELMGLAAQTLQGGDATQQLFYLACDDERLGLWAGERYALGSFDAAVSAGDPVVLLQLYCTAADDEASAFANDTEALAAVLARAEQPGRMLCAQPLRLSAEGARSALAAGVGQLAAALPAPHPLLPTHGCGLVAVSCSAKGRQMFESEGVEAAAIHAASRGLPLAGVYCDGEIGPAILNAKSALRWAGEAGGSALQGSSTILTALVGTR